MSITQSKTLVNILLIVIALHFSDLQTTCLLAFEIGIIVPIFRRHAIYNHCIKTTVISTNKWCGALIMWSDIKPSSPSDLLALRCFIHLITLQHEPILM